MDTLLDGEAMHFMQEKSGKGAGYSPYTDKSLSSGERGDW